MYINIYESLGTDLTKNMKTGKETNFLAWDMKKCFQVPEIKAEKLKKKILTLGDWSMAGIFSVGTYCI